MIADIAIKKATNRLDRIIDWTPDISAAMQAYIAKREGAGATDATDDKKKGKAVRKAASR